MAIAVRLKKHFRKGFAPSTPQARRVAEDRAQDSHTATVTPHPERLTYVQYAIRQGHTIKQIAKMTSIDPGFSTSSKKLTTCSWSWKSIPWSRFPPKCCASQAHGILRRSPRRNLASGCKGGQEKVRHFRKKHGLKPVYKRVDTAPPSSKATHLISTRPMKKRMSDTTRRRKLSFSAPVEPHRAGIEFDYCCCHASYALREDGYETIMINCNPRRSRPITTPATASTSSRSRSKTCLPSANTKLRARPLA